MSEPDKTPEEWWDAFVHVFDGHPVQECEHGGLIVAQVAVVCDILAQGKREEHRRIMALLVPRAFVQYEAATTIDYERGRRAGRKEGSRAFRRAGCDELSQQARDFGVPDFNVAAHALAAIDSDAVAEALE